MLVVGLTGGIACGKSSVSEIVRKEFLNSVYIIDADLIAKEIVEPGKPAYKNIVKYFRDKVPDLVNPEDQSLNRPKLGAYVFQNKSELLKLNSFTHPQVRYEIFKQILISYLKCYRMCVLDVPLLFEANLDTFCGKTVSVIISEQSKQIERLQKRNSFTEDEALSRINSQMTTHNRISRSSYVIDNNGTREELYNQVVDIFGDKLKPRFTIFLLELIPFVGLCSAINVILSNYLGKKYQSREATALKTS